MTHFGGVVNVRRKTASFEFNLDELYWLQGLVGKDGMSKEVQVAIDELEAMQPDKEQV